METDHIIPKADGGSDEIDNAIPVCFDCHAEIHLYNPAHPRGRKYTPEELKMHRDQWLDLANRGAQFLASIPAPQDVGPLQGLVDELEYNSLVASRGGREAGAPMSMMRFNDALANGAISLMDDKPKAMVYGAYAAISRANAYVQAMPSFNVGSDPWAQALNRATDALKQAKVEIDTVLAALREYLRPEA
jgi:hypothetical protein